jgi:single-strand DNA-binding protein
MPGVMIYAAGKVTNDLTYRESAKDHRHDFLSFTMAHNNGYPGEDGQWIQTSTLWLNVKAFGALARNARAVIAKGRPLLVHGELRHVPYDGADGHRHNYLELKADGIGLNLRFCAAGYVGLGERTREIPPETLAAAFGADVGEVGATAVDAAAAGGVGLEPGRRTLVGAGVTVGGDFDSGEFESGRPEEPAPDY